MVQLKFSFLILFSFMVLIASSKTLWGAKKRNEDNVDDENVGFLYKRPAPVVNVAKSKVVEPAATKRTEKKSNDAIANIKLMINIFSRRVDELLDSDQLDEVLSQDHIEKALEMFPQLTEIPEVQTLFQSGDGFNPEQYKESVVEGVKLFRNYLDEVYTLLDDPQKIKEALQKLPPEVSVIIESLLSGDMAPLKSMVMTMPGIDSSQRRLILDLLDGKTSSLQSHFAAAGLNNEDKMEEVRRQLLSSPDALAALGVDAEVLSDPSRFVDLMSGSLDSLMGMMGDVESPSQVQSGRAKTQRTARMHAV